MTNNTKTIDLIARAICGGLGDDFDREGERLLAYDKPAQAVLNAISEAGMVIVEELELKAQYHRGYYDGKTGNK